MSNFQNLSGLPPADDAVWSSRCWFWQDQLSRSNTRQSKKQKSKEPLILAGHGISLRIENGSLFIRGGLTHYPQKSSTYRFFRGELDLPERIILLDCSGSISFDVISWLAEQEIPLVQINWKGEIICLAGAPHMQQIPSAFAGKLRLIRTKVAGLNFAVR